MKKCTWLGLIITAVCLMVSGFALVIAGTVMIGRCWSNFGGGCENQATAYWVILWLGIIIALCGSGCIAAAKRIRFQEAIQVRRSSPYRPTCQGEVNYIVPDARESSVSPNQFLPYQCPPPAYENFAYNTERLPTTNVQSRTNLITVNSRGVLVGPPPAYDQVPKPW